jgi:hypothetical protein
MPSSLDLSRTYTSFSGVDIRAVVAGKPIGQLQAVSYAVQREKAPIYVMGRVDPLSFSRGKRGIAGTLISLLLDQHMLFGEPFSDMQFIADNDELFGSPLDLDNVSRSSLAGDLQEQADGSTFSAGSVSDNWSARQAFYVDQLPSFDIAIVAVNEYGKAATMRIYGCEILNEGSGFSIDDIVIENQMTYVCRTILPWQRLGEWSSNSNGSYGGFSAAASSTPTA